MIRPNFLYIGASKAGSTWLFECMRAHPEVFIPVAKDIQYFDHQYDKGLEWYFSFFKKATSYKAIGELSHDYFLYPEVASRIVETLPEVKMICCLREPVDKMISSYKYAKNIYLDQSVSFEEFIFEDMSNKMTTTTRKHTLTVQSAQYFQNLLPYYDRFPADNILVLFFDEIKSNPAAMMRKIFAFLQVDESFVPPLLHERVHSSSQARHTSLAHLTYDVAGVFRKLGMANLVGNIKRSSFINQLLYKTPRQKVSIDEKTLQKTRALFEGDYDALSKLIDQPLPKGW